MITEVSSPIGLVATLRRSAMAWRPYWRVGLVILLALFVQQLFLTFFAYSLKVIVDIVQGKSSRFSLGLIFAGLAVGFVLTTLAGLGGEKLIARASGLLMGDMRRQLFAKLQVMSVDLSTRWPLGDILGRFTGDLTVIQAGFTQATFITCLAAIGLLINVPVMLWLDWRLALLSLLSLPLILATNRHFVPRAGQATYLLRQTEGALANTVQETVRAQFVIKAFGLQRLLTERFDRQVDHLGDVMVRSRFAIALVGKSSSTLILFIQLVVTTVGAVLALRGDLSAGSLVAFLSILGVVSRDTYEFAKKAVPAFIEAGSGLRRVDEILQATPGVLDAVDAQPLPRLREHIRFTQVDFSYSDEQLQLASVDLVIPQGQQVAFVGPSGSGKSTVLSLLLRFYEPQRGCITFDSHDIAAATQDSLRGQMGVVFQENFLFNTSIRENIRLARPEATDAAVEAAARQAEIHDFILALPHGYETDVGEAGGRLSGGQRQRIAIARAILRDPAILLLDEATSALDPGAEAAINQTISRLARGRTVISVTHRLASVTEVDQIYVMQNGRLVEQGTHRSLLDQRGLYFELWQKQGGFEVSKDGRFAQIDAQRLKQVRLFETIDSDRLAYFANQFRSEFFEAGQDVIVEGEAGDKLYVIVRGIVHVLIRDETGKEHMLDCMEDGDYFGEMALLLDQPRSATIRTVTPSLLLSLSSEQFMAMLDQFPECRVAIDQRIAQSQANQAALRNGVMSSI